MDCSVPVKKPRPDGSVEMKVEADYFFEVAWEVCNKVGGIYTVIRSKVGPMLEYYGKNYFAVGPFFPKKTLGEFEEQVPPPELKNVFGRLEKEGIKCYFGRWLVNGDPNVVLIDFTGFAYKDNDIKKEFWDNFQVDSLGTEYHDFDEPVVWAYTVGRFIEEFRNEVKDKLIVAQFHEWMAGGGLLYLKQNDVPVATVFTTHATMLGRALSGSDMDIYAMWDKIDPIKEAYRCRIQAKHLMETKCANNADAFTTVSEPMGIEAEHLLGRKPDTILPNGLDLSKFPTFEEASIKHSLFREHMREFLLYYFFPYYSFDLDHTLFYFLCSRYEFHGKGMDTFIQALAQVNEKMKAEKTDRTIVTFFWVPANVKGIKQELLENKAYFDDIKDGIDDQENEIMNKLISLLVSKKEINAKNLFSEDFIFANKKKVLKFMRTGTPPLATHDFYDELGDPILKSLRENGLLNREEDRVKVIFYPIYLTGADGLLDLTYYECIQGSHLGVFPSYYEPWGYTPLEAAVLGVPAVTTDLAGFGRYLLRNAPETEHPGIFILPRMNKNAEEENAELAKILYEYAMLPKEGRTRNKVEAKRKTNLVDWRILVKNYIYAHNLAVQKKVCQGK